MKVLVCSDLHGWFDKIDAIKRLTDAENPDIILCAGDMTEFGKQQRKVLEKLNDMGKPMLIIHGNHESPDALRADCEDFEHLTYIHKGAFRKDNYVFFGFGGGGFASSEPMFARLAKHFERELQEGDVAILMTHQPPRNTKLDDLNGKRVGAQEFTDFIKACDVKLAVSGHIHENFGKEDKLGDCILINPGPKGRIYEL